MARKSEYPLDELCLAQKKNEPDPCQNPRRTCEKHCNASLRKSDGSARCATTPEKTTLRCRLHGGVPLIGVSNPNFKDGSYSRYTSVLTGTKLRHFEDALNDPAHIEMREQLALLDMLLMDALERSQLGQTSHLWKRLKAHAENFRIASRRQQEDRAARELDAMLQIVEDGAAAHEAMNEVANLIERQRRVKDSERKRIADEKQSISASRALTFAQALFETVKRNLAGNPYERELLANISRELAGHVQQALPGGRALTGAEERED